MNKQMNNVRGAQAGFTLIELIVVIVILGILAATALPKFADLGGDARAATLRAARGSLESTSAMAHGKFLVNGISPVVMEDTNVALTNGYPTAAAELGDAAGLKTGDWTRVLPGAAATTNLPAAGATQIAFVPVSVATTTKGLNCYVRYTQAAANAAPVIDVVVTSC